MPRPTSVSFQMSTDWTLERNCASSGLARVKSRAPSRTDSTSFCMLGWITMRIAPPTMKKTPTRASTSSGVHPPRVCVYEKITARPAMAVPSSRTDSTSCTRKLTR